jgi:hypothetical protein
MLPPSRRSCADWQGHQPIGEIIVSFEADSKWDPRSIVFAFLSPLICLFPLLANAALCLIDAVQFKCVGQLDKLCSKSGMVSLPKTSYSFKVQRSLSR